MLSLNTLPLSEIANEYDTPFYIYEADTIETNYQTLQKCFSNQLEIFYSIKANPNISICSLLKNYGAGAEVCSLIELETALRVGFQPQNIIFVGPYKSCEAIQKCIDNKIYAIVCESEQELFDISRLAKANTDNVNVALRINPNFVSPKTPLKMGGKPTQFGIDQDEALAKLELFFKIPHLNLMGIHIYNGTRILDAETIYFNTCKIFELVASITKKTNRFFAMIDIGGGIGIPYFSNEKAINIVQLQKLMTPLIKSFTQQYPGRRLILESGRFLVGNAGALVCRVRVIKKSRGKTFLITDGGTHCHMAAVGIGSVMQRNFPIRTIKHLSTQQTKIYQITGPLCTPNDLIAKDIELPQIELGDLIAIESSGAYGPSASPVNFLSHGQPAEVLFYDNKIHLIRQRDTVDDLHNKQILIR